MTHTSDRQASTTTTLTMRLAAACRDPRHHRALVLAANAGLVACGVTEPFAPALALHLLLLPFNAWQLLLALRAVRTTHPLAAGTVRVDAVATRQKAESMRCQAYNALAAMRTVRLSPRKVR